MSNSLSVRRVKVQTIDEHGNPEGEAMFGVMASDDYFSDYNDTFPTLESLNEAIDDAGSILKIVDEKKFVGADFGKVGTGNFYGKDWMINDD